MFADVVRSMDIARTVGAERLGEIMAELVRRSTEVVHAHGGVVNQFTGDGLMAVFGAPKALEDHARLACLAALRVREEARSLAVEVAARDGTALRIRVGLNSGQVIAGEIGLGSLGYATIGEHVGLAQRMESVAPSDGVVLSAATAALVEHCAVLGEPECVLIKGRTTPVTVRRLLAVRATRTPGQGRWDPDLVGRAAELEAVADLLDHVCVHGSVIARIVGPAGIGKTRIVAEASEMAAARAIPVYSTYCDSHLSDVSRGSLRRLLQAVFRVTDERSDAARSQLNAELADMDLHDRSLLEDLLGTGDPAAPSDIAPEARQRRVITLLRDVLVARSGPAVVIVEDAHWIDEASEEMFAELADGLAPTETLMLITHRPDYVGRLIELPGARTIVLEPLPDAHTATLAAQLLGSHLSVRDLARKIVEKAGGNPFFVTEIVRDLAEREILAGRRGDYRCEDPSADLAVPATLQATIAARIDRLGHTAKSVLYVGAVIGLRFEADLLDAVLEHNVHVDAAMAELSAAEFVVPCSPRSTFAFRHPLVHKAAYTSQLKATRAHMHRRVAMALQAMDDSASADQKAESIASHLHAAGDLRAAFDWYMRAGRWLNNRDRTAAWASWQRAREVADALPADDPDRAARQIAALTRLCGEVWKTGGDLGDAGFSQLRELCRATGDHHSLAIGMGGMVMGLTGQHRHDEAAGLTSELLTLLESLHDPAVVCNLLLSVTYAKSEIGEVRQALELAQRVIDMADHDLAKSGVLFGSPLASATRMRGLYRLSLGIPGWREDGHAAVLMSRGMDPTSQVSAVMYKYILSVPVRARTVDDAALRETAAALRIAEQAGDYLTLTLAQTARGLVLLHSDKPTQEGADVLEEARRTSVARGFTMNAMALIDPVLARHEALRGDLDASIRLARDAIATMAERREALSMGVATSVLVESLLRRRAHGDMSEAVAALDHLAGLPTDEGFVLYEWPMMRLRGLVARACGDDASAEGHLQRYRALARSADFDVPTGDFMS